ncbi:MAG: hypothetical protein FJ304_24790 [Planctomycetes bacterium]|nr:hypothetical protein [Planctomycetota bacterium]
MRNESIAPGTADATPVDAVPDTEEAKRDIVEQQGEAEELVCRLREHLTDDELKLFECLHNGFSNEQIMAVLNASQNQLSLLKQRLTFQSEMFVLTTIIGCQCATAVQRAYATALRERLRNLPAQRLTMARRAELYTEEAAAQEVLPVVFNAEMRDARRLAFAPPDVADAPHVV